jgi:hypothetical protein
MAFLPAYVREMAHPAPEVFVQDAPVYVCN